jgi:hypothetical protein
VAQPWLSFPCGSALVELTRLAERAMTLDAREPLGKAGAMPRFAAITLSALLLALGASCASSPKPVATSGPTAASAPTAEKAANPDAIPPLDEA